MPASVQFVDAGSLGTDALGAYDSANGGTLYLDRSLLSGDPAKLQSVFNEEMGHHFDAVLGGADAIGDEGAVFALTLDEGPLDQSTLSSLRSENDHGLILVDGRLIEVEFRNENEGSGDGHGGAGGTSSDSGDSSAGSCGPNSSGGSTSNTSDSGESDNDSDSDGDSDASGVGSCGPDSSGDTSAAGSDTGNSDGPSESDNDNDSDNDSSGIGECSISGDSGAPDGSVDSDPPGAPGGDDRDNDRDNDNHTRGANPASETPAPDDPPPDTEPDPEPEPEPQEKRGFWSRALDTVQTGLDFAGFVPGLGAVPDLVNAGIHLARGNRTEAAISAAAAIPGAGDTFKAGVMGVRAADRANDARRAVNGLEEAVDYSRPSGFRKGTREQVWDDAVEPSTGRVRDPVTGRL